MALTGRLRVGCDTLVNLIKRVAYLKIGSRSGVLRALSNHLNQRAVQDIIRQSVAEPIGLNSSPRASEPWSPQGEGKS
jgi:hypothetical protein